MGRVYFEVCYNVLQTDNQDELGNGVPSKGFDLDVWHHLVAAQDQRLLVERAAGVKLRNDVVPLKQQCCTTAALRTLLAHYWMQLVRLWCVPRHSNSVRDTDWRSLFPLVSPPRPGEAVNTNVLPAYGVVWLSSWRMPRKAA